MIAPASDFKAFSVVEVASQLGVSRHTVDRLIASGQLRAVAIGAGNQRKTKRILSTDLERYLNSASTTPTPEPPRKRKRKRDPDFIEYYK